MERKFLSIKANRALNQTTYEMVCEGDNLKAQAGQFAEFSLDGFYLRRPISVCDSTDKTLTIVYKVVGEGTKKMTELKSGETLDVLVGLGNGFDVLQSKTPLLIGGGIGAAPLYQLAKEFNAIGVKPTIVLGFRNKDEIFYEREFAKLGNLIIATDDGSYGKKGNALAVLKAEGITFDKYYACGPQIMLKFLQQFSKNGQLSLEARMGCGFGACMGCSIKTVNGNKRVCKEGPVFEAAEVVFD